jgi:hypothetical protein
VDNAFESGGLYPNIHSVYLLVSLTGHPIFGEWSGQIRRIVSEYLFGVSIGKPDRLSNIQWMVGLD